MVVTMNNVKTEDIISFIIIICIFVCCKLIFIAFLIIWPQNKIFLRGVVSLSLKNNYLLAGSYTWINPPPVFSNVDEILRGSEAMIGHKLVPMESSRRKRCKYCQKLRQKTASGGIAETAYHCQACLVPLCPGIKTGRNCFSLYHMQFVLPFENSDMFKIQKL